MAHRELVERALRVLVAWIEHRAADPKDIAALKAAVPKSAEMPLDELACYVIHFYSPFSPRGDPNWDGGSAASRSEDLPDLRRRIP